jgi:hypothetical protein
MRTEDVVLLISPKTRDNSVYRSNLKLKRSCTRSLELVARTRDDVWRERNGGSVSRCFMSNVSN